MTGQSNIYIEGVGTDTEDITRVAHEVDGLGTDIGIEKVIGNDFSKPVSTFEEVAEEVRTPTLNSRIYVRSLETFEYLVVGLGNRTFAHYPFIHSRERVG